MTALFAFGSVPIANKLQYGAVEETVAITRGVPTKATSHAFVSLPPVRISTRGKLSRIIWIITPDTNLIHVSDDEAISTALSILDLMADDKASTVADIKKLSPTFSQS